MSRTPRLVLERVDSINVWQRGREMFILYYTPVYLPIQLHYYIQMPRQVAEDATCVLRSRLKVDLVTRDVLSCLLSLESFGWETTHLLPFLSSKGHVIQDTCLFPPARIAMYCLPPASSWAHDHDTSLQRSEISGCEHVYLSQGLLVLSPSDFARHNFENSRMYVHVLVAPVRIAT